MRHPTWQHHIHHWGPWHFSYLVLSLWLSFWFNQYNINVWHANVGISSIVVNISLLFQLVLDFQYWVGQVRAGCCQRSDDLCYDLQDRTRMMFAAEVGERSSAGRWGCRGSWGLGGSSLISLLPWKSMDTTNFHLWFALNSPLANSVRKKAWPQRWYV